MTVRANTKCYNINNTKISSSKQFNKRRQWRVLDRDDDPQTALGPDSMSLVLSDNLVKNLNCVTEA